MIAEQVFFGVVAALVFMECMRDIGKWSEKRAQQREVDEEIKNWKRRDALEQELLQQYRFCNRCGCALEDGNKSRVGANVVCLPCTFQEFVENPKEKTTE